MVRFTEHLRLMRPAIGEIARLAILLLPGKLPIHYALEAIEREVRELHRVDGNPLASLGD
jgi:hypothetical protein